MVPTGGSPTGWYDWVQFGIQGGTLVFLVIYVVKTWQMASATRAAAEASSKAAEEALQARLQAMAPRILVYFNPEEIFFAELIVQNAGAGTARDVEFRFDPPLKSSQQGHHPEQFFETPKAMIPPGHRIRLYFDTWPSLLKTENPRRYTIDVTYHGAENNLGYSVTHVLDVADHEHRVEMHRKGMHDLVNEVEKGREEIANRLDRIHRDLEEEFATRGYAAAGRESFASRLPAVRTKAAMLRDWALSGGFDVWWGPAFADYRTEILGLAIQAERERLPKKVMEAVRHLQEVVFRHGYVGDKGWHSEMNEGVEAVLSAVSEGYDKSDTSGT